MSDNKDDFVKDLAAIAWEDGEAKKYGYLLERRGDLLELSFRKKLVAKFRVTGFEQGFLEEDNSSTDRQRAVVDALVDYFTGKKAA